MSASEVEPIAVVGIGCRFPGGVENAGGLWDLAAAGRHTVGPVPEGRWNSRRLAAIHDPEIAERAGIGCFLEGDVWAWDPAAFSVAPSEQRWVDPQFRVLMEVAWEAVEHAGIPMDRMRGSRTGVYIGTYAPDNLFREARPVEDSPNSPYLFGNFTAGAAGRVAFSMDLRGPSMVVSTHCSSGLVALDAACGALTLGECDTALAGAVLLMVSPETHYYEAPLLLSQRGACHAFDARADGYVRGEGAGVLVLKRLADARAAGDRVLAVIRGSAVNNDGQATRLTAPSTEVQQALFREAVKKAGIDPGEVGLVEAHGPGTAVGDPVEYTSIDAVYGHGRGRCALGSVKTNIGHTEPVSGIAGAIKAIESLRRGVIPPNLHFREWNPAIQRDGSSRLFVPTELTEWPVPGEARLAAVCSYGVTGTNAHVVLEAAPAAPRRRPAGRSAGLYLLSGNSPKALQLSAGRLADWARTAGGSVDALDVRHTLAQRRAHADQRLAVAARDLDELSARARAFAAGETADGTASGPVALPPGHAGPVLVFTGQGSQRPDMCRGMLAGEPVFAAAIDELEPLIQAEGGFSVRKLIEAGDVSIGIERVQPMLFAVQIALAAVWRSWGVQPAAVIGQSLGEVAAAVVAGALGLADGVKVICRRAALLATISGGAMASVMLGEEEVRAAIERAGADGVSLGVLTSPGTTVVSGDSGQVAALVEAWTAQGTVARMIDVDVASHSPKVDPILDELRTALAGVSALPPGTGFFSTVSEDPEQPGPLDGAYWVRNQRDPVRFRTAVSAALAAGHRLFIECTAHPLAVRPILDTAQADGVRDAVAVGTLRQGLDDQDAFLTHLGAVHCAGYEGIDWSAHHDGGDLADVPGTTWERVRLGGDEEPHVLVAPGLVGAEQHPLLGGHVRDPQTPDQHLWQTPISPGRLPWLDDHRVAGVPVLPGTGFAEMLLASGARVFGTDRIAVSDLRVDHPLVLDPEPLVTTRLLRTDGSAEAEVLSFDEDGGVVVHARGTVRPLSALDAAPPADPSVPAGPEWADSSPADLYRHFRERHNVQHGPAFTALDGIQVHAEEDRAVARLRIAETARVSAWAMALHPALADEVVQTVVSVWLAHHATSPGPVVVAGFEEIRLYGPTAHTRLAAVELHKVDDLTCVASARLVSASGTVVAEIRGLRLANITPPAERFASRLAHLAWVPEPTPTAEEPADGRWLVLAEDGPVWPRRLCTMLGQRSAGSRLLTRPEGVMSDAFDAEEIAAALDEDTPHSPTSVLIAITPAADQDRATAARKDVDRVTAILQQLAHRTDLPRLWVVWRSDDGPLGAAGLRGLLRVAAFEHPELRPSSIELAGDTPLDVLLDDLLATDRPMVEIAWRQQERRVARVRTGPAPFSLPTPVRTDGAYLVTGGLGGLGLLTTRWLAEQGMRRVVLCGRSAPSAHAERVLEELRASTGADLTVALGDLGDPSTVQLAIAAAVEGGLPLRGIVHAAGLVEDAVLANLDQDLTARVWRGKADGAWALHQASIDHELDHFVVYSSVASLLGSPGQAAYAAANGFLDALVEWRQSQGLPATGIHWGAWSEVGRGRHLARQRVLMISPADGIAALERILTDGHRRIAYSPIDVWQWTAPYPAVRGSALLAELLGEAPASEETSFPVRDELLAAPSGAERRLILEEFIITQVRELLGGGTRHIGPHTSMVLLGLDSLGAVQLQQRLQQALGIEIKAGVIWVKPSAASLAEWLDEHLAPAPFPDAG
ncbi:SDR family NAD(P)-dependent oxidoreductase [Kitasatospora sp. NPDC049285]|uniref:type I polyketide synthase n=1 Tax=Kitasatospora sp. NPDC049285 TaxID=3157096 RepID=UPI00344092D0